MTPPRANKPEVLAALEAVASGATYSEAAREHGVSASTVMRAARKAGLQSPKATDVDATLQHGATPRRLPKAIAQSLPVVAAELVTGKRGAQALAQMLRGMTPDEAAAEMGVEVATWRGYYREGVATAQGVAFDELVPVYLHLVQGQLRIADDARRAYAEALEMGEPGDAARMMLVAQSGLAKVADLIDAKGIAERLAAGAPQDAGDDPVAVGLAQVAAALGGG